MNLNLKTKTQTQLNPPDNRPITPKNTREVLRTRIQELESIERSMAAEFEVADKVVRSRKAEFDAAQNAVLIDGRPLEESNAAHELLNASIQARSPKAEQLKRHRELLTRARDIFASTENEALQAQIDGLTAEYRSAAIAFAEKLGACAEAAAHWKEITDRAFSIFPHGSKPGLPEEPFYSRVRPIREVLPLPGASLHQWLEAFIKLYGAGALPPAALAQLESCNRQRQAQVDEEERHYEVERQRSERQRTAWANMADTEALVIDLRGVKQRAQGVTLTVPVKNTFPQLEHATGVPAEPVTGAEIEAATNAGVSDATRRNREREQAHEAMFPTCR